MHKMNLIAKFLFCFLCLLCFFVAMDIEAYLKRIKYTGSLGPDAGDSA